MRKCSTESVHFKVLNAIFRATDSGHCVLLILTDLSAAFAAVDHNILINQVEESLGITSLGSVALSIG